MPSIPTKILNRISVGLKKFQPIVESAKIRDVNESDTVVILTGIFSDILGYDKYSEITTELSIRGTYCDLAIKINEKIVLLIEAKAVGIELKEQHVKQAVDYAANKGIEWVILSNGVQWKVFKIVFSKPIENILVIDFDFLKINPKVSDGFEPLYFLCKEAVSKFSLDNFYSQKQAVNKYLIGTILLDEKVLNTVRKELKTIYPDIKVSNDEIQTVMMNDVLRRETFESEEAKEAKRKISKGGKKVVKPKKSDTNSSLNSEEIPSENITKQPDLTNGSQ